MNGEQMEKTNPHKYRIQVQDVAFKTWRNVRPRPHSERFSFDRDGIYAIGVESAYYVKEQLERANGANFRIVPDGYL